MNNLKVASLMQSLYQNGTEAAAIAKRKWKIGKNIFSMIFSVCQSFVENASFLETEFGRKQYWYALNATQMYGNYIFKTYNRNNMIKLIFGINYTGNLKSFQWNVELTLPPVFVSVGFQRIHQKTHCVFFFRKYTVPWNTCPVKRMRPTSLTNKMLLHWKISTKPSVWWNRNSNRWFFNKKANERKKKGESKKQDANLKSSCFSFIFSFI